MEDNKSSSLLPYAAKKASKNGFFLAEYLTEFRLNREISETELAEFLGCSPLLISKLALCRRPEPASPRFRADVEQIGIAFDIQPNRLVQLIREVDAIRALAEVRVINQEAPEGLLAVARDSKEIEPDNRRPTEPSDGEQEEK